MGWADDMYENGYTEEHGGLMRDVPSTPSRPRVSNGKKSGPGSRWSQHDLNQMVDMYEADISIREIAEELNRTPLAIAYQLYNKGKISSSIKDKFLHDRSFNTSIRLINRNVNYHKKIARKKSTKAQKLKTEEDKFKENRSCDGSVRTINHGLYNHKKNNLKEKTKFHGLKIKILGFILIAIAVFGWTGYWFAGSGFAALIALGFLVTGISLISSNHH